MAESASFSQIVVVGSSAGGIDALSTLVSTFPADFPAPIVLAQHLDPSRESHLSAILSRSSTLPVHTVAEYERLQPGVIYAVPANRDVEITDHDIRLHAGSQRSQPSIDRLFASAAHIFDENLVAVVLTGTGSDGAAGALEVHKAGGTVIIQDPVTASFPALPRALSPSVVDFVLPLEDIGATVYALLTGGRTIESEDEDAALTRLLRMLQDRHGIDFRSYKPGTIVRRVQRRLAITGIPTIAEYRQYAVRHPEEQQALIASFLIKVTDFFRDPELFESLRQHVLPDLVQTARVRDYTLRFWSAGCATGEEAYSLAILLAEVLGEELEQFNVRIFATDLDPDAIAFARQGLYSAASLASVDAHLVDRYFDAVDGGYQISKRIRGLTVFGEHDLADRAPFPRVDLVLCRNVLIYFTAELQRRILQIFAFSLRDGGYLFLGKSETTSPLPDAFVADDAQLKIYRRRGDRIVIPAPPMRDVSPSGPVSPRTTPPRPTMYARGGRPQGAVPREQPFGLRADSLMFDLPAGVVVVDPRYDVQYINDAARTFLGIFGTAVGEDLIHQVQTVQPSELRNLVDRAMSEEKGARGTLSGTDGSANASRHLEIVCRVSTVAGGDARVVTICLWDVTRREEEAVQHQEELARAREGQERAEEQRSRVVATNRELLSTNQQLAREIAELRGQNEEFLVGNEELQAATEEVETLNEELQATNEELETLNEELQATVEELNTTNDDLHTRNLEIQELAARLEGTRSRLHTVLNSLPDAVVLMDQEGRTLLTNAQYDQVFAGPLESLDIRGADGRPLSDGDTLQQRAARGESFIQIITVTNGAPTRSAEQRTFEVTGRAIRAGESDGGGGVLVLRELPTEGASI